MKHSNIAIFLPHLGCTHQCTFCNQNRISGVQKSPEPSMVKRILQEAVSYLKKPEETEIAFFGGSFTALSEKMQEAYLAIAKPIVDEYHLKGIRVSTRPDAIDTTILTRLKYYGVTAVELGAQSMDEEVLLLNKRGHTATDVERAASAIKQAGLELGLQMMTGLYGDNGEKALQTAQKLIALSPKTVRIYPTVVLPDTALADYFAAGVYQPPTAVESVDLCATLLEQFERANIAVIKLGLHAEESVASTMLAGCYHPAFRELCEARRYLKKVSPLLCDKSGRVTILVAKGECSKMIGQKRENIVTLEDTFPIHLQVKEDAALKKGQILLQ